MSIMVLRTYNFPSLPKWTRFVNFYGNLFISSDFLEHVWGKDIDNTLFSITASFVIMYLSIIMHVFFLSLLFSLSVFPSLFLLFLPFLFFFTFFTFLLCYSSLIPSFFLLLSLTKGPV